VPRPVDSRSTYLPGLDGVRAVAVIAVLGYHFGVPTMGGGLLGVSVFFTLSGFLITGILLAAWQQTGRIPFGQFYLARARRLLPALAVVLVTVLMVTALVDRDELGQRWRETAAAAGYVSNWFTIHTGSSYFDLFAGPSPLEHLWSLAVEEQFYLIWPVLLLVLLRLSRGRTPRVALYATGLAAASFLLLAVLAHSGIDNTRPYEGTDTRAGELLVGAALALVYRPTRITFTPPPAVRAGVDLAGLAALVGIGWLVVSTSTFSLSLYRGGLLLLALLSAVLLVAVTYPGSLSGRVLGSTVPRWLGERSYGIYLWHMPVVAFTPHHEPGTAGDWFWPAILDLALTLLLASLSWSLIEDPIRRHGLLSLVRRPVVPYRRGKRRPRPVMAGALAVVAIATTAFSPVSLMTASSGQDQVSAGGGAPPEPPQPPLPSSAAPTPTGRPSARPSTRPTTAAPTRPAGRTGKPRTTACTSVVHVGDSTSIGLMDPNYLPNPRDRIDAQYRQVGARSVQTDILCARSIVEHYKGQPNAQEAVAQRIDAGYDGCWVLAMGTNEAANVSVGSNVGVDERIDLLMREIKGQPAMWLTVKTLRTSGPWAENQMQKWNAALQRACGRYPNMRVYDWASQVQDPWFISDGIHFTTPGYRERARRTALALTAAFPAEGNSPTGCLITP
jgi:peptidoglycan/LPS O-acetylase OafA/YrhL